MDFILSTPRGTRMDASTAETGTGAPSGAPKKRDFCSLPPSSQIEPCGAVSKDIMLVTVTDISCTMFALLSIDICGMAFTMGACGFMVVWRKTPRARNWDALACVGEGSVFPFPFAFSLPVAFPLAPPVAVVVAPAASVPVPSPASTPVHVVSTAVPTGGSRVVSPAPPGRGEGARMGGGMAVRALVLVTLAVREPTEAHALGVRAPVGAVASDLAG